jgi:hypothetical protein
MLANPFSSSDLPVHFPALLLFTLTLGACANIHESPDYERHRFSQIVEPYDRKDVMYFDVTFSAQYPDDDEAAEAIRMAWLEGWLDQRNKCQDGFEIVARRPFEMLEDNPAHHDLRYEFKCQSRPVGA